MPCRLLYPYITVPYDTWYDYECEFEQASKDHPQTIITLYYEDMIKVSIVIKDYFVFIIYNF